MFMGQHMSACSIRPWFSAPSLIIHDSFHLHPFCFTTSLPVCLFLRNRKITIPWNLRNHLATTCKNKAQAHISVDVNASLISVARFSAAGPGLRLEADNLFCPLLSFHCSVMTVEHTGK